MFHAIVNSWRSGIKIFEKIENESRADMLSVIILGEYKRSLFTVFARKKFKLNRKTIGDGREEQQKLVFHLAFYIQTFLASRRVIYCSVSKH